MSKSLKTLIRIARWTVDERQKTLGMLLGREEQVQTAIADHRRALETERALATSDTLGVGRSFENYLALWRDQLQQKQGLLAQIQTQIATAREELAEAYRERKSVEEAQRQRDAQAALEADRKDRAELDEIGLTQYLKRKD